MNQQFNLTHPKESRYFWLSLFISIIFYIISIVTILPIIYVLMFALLGFFVLALTMGQIRGNGIRISERQFPDVYERIKVLSMQMGIKKVPNVYIVELGGVLNAFAVRFLGKDYVVIFSSVFELAYEKGEKELDFVIAHELGHIKENHGFWQWILWPSLFIPFLSMAYSRACEYTADRYALRYAPEKAEEAILILAAGQKLSSKMDAGEYVSQINEGMGFWAWIAEKLASHPVLPKRIRELRQLK